MNKICTSLILFFSLVTSLLYGQNATLKGVVKSKTDEKPLIGVTVIDETNNGTATDAEGKYVLSLPPGNHVISFKLISFAESKMNVAVDPGIGFRFVLDRLRQVHQLGALLCVLRGVKEV